MLAETFIHIKTCAVLTLAEMPPEKKEANSKTNTKYQMTICK